MSGQRNYRVAGKGVSVERELEQRLRDPLAPQPRPHLMCLFSPFRLLSLSAETVRDGAGRICTVLPYKEHFMSRSG